MTKALRPRRNYQPPTKPPARRKGFKMQFYIIETPDYKYHVRIWRKMNVVCDKIVETLKEAQALVNTYLEKSMV